MLMSNSLFPFRVRLAVPPADFLVKKIVPPSDPSIPPWRRYWPRPRWSCRGRSNWWWPARPQPAANDKGAIIAAVALPASTMSLPYSSLVLRADRREGGFFGGGGSLETNVSPCEVIPADTVHDRTTPVGELAKAEN